MSALCHKCHLTVSGQTQVAQIRLSGIDGMRQTIKCIFDALRNDPDLGQMLEATSYAASSPMRRCIEMMDPKLRVTGSMGKC